MCEVKTSAKEKVNRKGCPVKYRREPVLQIFSSIFDATRGIARFFAMVNALYSQNVFDIYIYILCEKLQHLTYSL